MLVLVQEFETSSVLITEETPIPEFNRGYKLLCRFGWQGTGEGLGKSNQGIREPIVLQSSIGFLGVGKQLEYDSITAQVTKERKKASITKVMLAI